MEDREETALHGVEGRSGRGWKFAEDGGCVFAVFLTFVCFEGRDESGGGSHSEQDLLRDWHSYFCIFGYIFDGQERIIEFLGWGREIEG